MKKPDKNEAESQSAKIKSQPEKQSKTKNQPDKPK